MDRIGRSHPPFARRGLAVIVDASVAVKWFTVEVLHDEARALLTGAEPLLAPDILAALETQSAPAGASPEP